MENLRLLHFLLHHSKVQNPSRGFLDAFEKLITTGSIPGAGKKLARTK